MIAATKLIIPALIAAGAFSAGMITDKKMTKPPVCNCPTVNIPPCPAAVSLQNFDVDKLQNKKGNFTYSPQLHNVTVKIESKDSLLIKSMLKSSK